MLIVTIPPPHQYSAGLIANTTGIDAFRFNTGVSVPDPAQTLKQLKEMIPPRIPLWVDLKCRQLRIVSWADPSFTEIELNREIEVELPASIYFRGDTSSNISYVKGNKVFLASPPETCVGKGQSVNILAKNLIIKGPFLTELDRTYLSLCTGFNLKHVMCSFVESWEDVRDIASAFSEEIYLKIESLRGVKNIVGSGEPLRGIRLELARDDLFVQLRGNATQILQATQQTQVRDNGALVASRFFTGLQQTGEATLADMEDIVYLYALGYRDFMFQDSLSNDINTLRKAVGLFHECITWAQDKRLRC
jgi:hypothetical protein